MLLGRDNVRLAPHKSCLLIDINLRRNQTSPTVCSLQQQILILIFSFKTYINEHSYKLHFDNNDTNHQYLEMKKYLCIYRTELKQTKEIKKMKLIYNKKTLITSRCWCWCRCRCWHWRWCWRWCHSQRFIRTI